MAAESAVPQLEECRRILETVEKAARSMGVRDVEVVVGGQAEALTRFSNNAIHQNVFERGRAVSVRVLLDQRTGRATTNRLDADALRRVLEEAVALTKASAPDPGLLPLAAPEPVAESGRFDCAIASSTPGHRAEAVAEAIGIVESASQTAAGIFSTEQGAEALFNTAGVAVYQAETLARFSITAMAGDSSGWAKASATRLESIDVRALATSARDKARLSASPREIEPGRYTVVLEPAAVLDLVGQMVGDFSGTAIEDQRSFLCDRLGEPLFGENINIVDDVRHPLQAGPTYDGEGVPRQKLRLVEKGIPLEVAWSRAAAKRAGRAPTGHGYPLPNELGESPINIVIEGGSDTLEGMIASTSRGILVTRLWYIREVDPYEKIMTGMTRDGTFLIEDGQVVCGLRNFRFNQSLIEMLSSVEALSPAVRASGEEAFDMVAPAMKVRDFHFNEVTRF